MLWWHRLLGRSSFAGAAPAWLHCGWGWASSSPVLFGREECLERGSPLGWLIWPVDVLCSRCRDTELVYLALCFS